MSVALKRQPPDSIGASLLAERFVHHEGRVLDLATGRAVTLRIGALADEWRELERRGEMELDAQAHEALVDFGRVAQSEWFEARLPRERAGAVGVFLDRDPLRRFVTNALHRADQGHGFVSVPIPVRADPLHAMSFVGRLLRLAGYVPLHAGLSLTDAVARQVQHRHVALLMTERESSMAAQWIHWLARVSARRHLAIALSQPAASCHRPSIARERAPSRPQAAARAAPSRVAATPIWCAVVSHLECLIDHDEWDAAVTDGVRYLRMCRVQGARDDDLQGRSEAMAILARAATRRAELPYAEHLLRSHDIALQLHGGARPASVLEAWCELRFWQGRFEETDTVNANTSSGDCLFVGLSAWARGDAAKLAEILAEGRPVSDAARGALSALRASLTGDRPRLERCRRQLTRQLPCIRPLHRRRLLRTILIQAQQGRDAPCRSTTALWGPDEEWAKAPALDRLLRERLECATAGGGGRAAADIERRITTCGAAGLTRWGTGGRSVQMLEAMPAVLQVVQNAEDDLAALTRSCAWMRHECRARAVAFFARDGFVAGDNWPRRYAPEAALRVALDGRDVPPTNADEERIAAMPVRHAGVVIGAAVVISGRESACAGDLTQAAATLAAVCASPLRACLDAVDTTRASHTRTPEILGRSPAIVALRDAVVRAATTPFPVLLEGESGTGKELVARALHRLSARRDRRLSAVNCAALSDELFEAELFGHARGAFTGAVGARVGLVEDAHGSTLFLDEVGELTGRAQAKLLRVLQEREVRRVGENTSRPVDVRIVAATNRRLTDAVAAGMFREDLLFRLAVVCLRLPPLRERVEDVALLAQTFWRPTIETAGKRAVLGPDALAALSRHAWPGNVRQLQNAITALAVLAPPRGRVTSRHVSQVLDESCLNDSAVVPLARARELFERRTVAAALARHGQRRLPAARELGLTRQGLAKALRRLGMETETSPPRTQGVA